MTNVQATFHVCVDGVFQMQTTDMVEACEVATEIKKQNPDFLVTVVITTMTSVKVK
jgi:hypothetical protein